MKNLAKTSFYASAGILLTAVQSVNAAIEVGTVNQDIVTAGSADQVVQGYIANALTFLYLVAVVFGIWGGFNILTAGGDEEKVKKGKTIIIQALIGVVVIFLAGTVVEWLTKAILA